MKLPIAIFFITVTAIGAPKPPPTPDPSTISRADLLKTVVHIQQLAQEQQLDLDNEKASELKIGKALADATIENGVLQKQIQAQTDKLNLTQDKLDKAEKSLWWYRLHWWGAWVMLGLGVAACVFFAILKVTGKLATTGAVVAAKIP